MWVDLRDHHLSCDISFCIVQKKHDVNFPLLRGLSFTPDVQMLNRAEDKLESQPEKTVATRWVC